MLPAVKADRLDDGYVVQRWPQEVLKPVSGGYSVERTWRSFAEKGVTLLPVRTYGVTSPSLLLHGIGPAEHNSKPPIRKVRVELESDKPYVVEFREELIKFITFRVKV